MNKILLTILVTVLSTSVYAQTSCVTDPAGNVQCTGFDNNGGMSQSTTTQLPNGNFQTNGVDANGDSYTQTCYTTPGGTLICN